MISRAKALKPAQSATQQLPQQHSGPCLGTCKTFHRGQLGATACVTGISYEHQFKFPPFCFFFSSLLMQLGKQQEMAQELGLLPLTCETWMEFLTSVLSLAPLRTIHPIPVCEFRSHLHSPVQLPTNAHHEMEEVMAQYLGPCHP